MPKSLGCLVEEMFWSANSSLYLYGTLTVGACLCIDAHGSHEQKQKYLRGILTGEDQWCQLFSEPGTHQGSGLFGTEVVAMQQMLQATGPGTGV